MFAVTRYTEEEEDLMGKLLLVLQQFSVLTRDERLRSNAISYTNNVLLFGYVLLQHTQTHTVPNEGYIVDTLAEAF